MRRWSASQTGVLKMGIFEGFKPIQMDASPEDVKNVGVAESIQALAKSDEVAKAQQHEQVASDGDVEGIVAQITDEKGFFKSIPLDMLSPTPEQWNRFTPVDDDTKIQMAKSILLTGLQQPIVVRELSPEPSGYQILAGNTRAEIYRILHEHYGDRYGSIRALVYKYGTIDDDTARQIVIDTNYAQRGELPKKDKMFAIHEKLAFLRKRREKDALSSVAKMIDRNRTTVYYWDAIYNLIPELFELFERDTINLVMAAKLGSYDEDVQQQLASVKDLITNDIVKALPRFMLAEEAVDTFNSVLEAETMPQKEPPRGEWHVKRSARSIHVTVVGKHDAYEPYVVLIPKKKAKSFVKKYDEFILRPDEAEDRKENE